MTSIFPGAVAGGLPVTSPLVENADIPPVAFDATCSLFLPSDCTARILPSQINAISSELLNLAACFDPDGEWNCASLSNLCTAFTNYRTQTGAGTLDRDVQDLLCEKSVVAAPGVGSRMLFCDGNGDVHKAAMPFGDGETITATFPFSTIPDGVVAQICADSTAAPALADCLISTDIDNLLRQGADGLLYVPSHQILFRHTDTTPVNPVPINTGTIAVNGNFTIPNSFNLPIDVLVTVTGHTALNHIGAVVGVTQALVTIDVASDAGFVGVLAGPHLQVKLDGASQIDDPSQVAVFVLTVPPGGRQLFYRFNVGSAIPANQWQMLSPTLSFVAHGVYAVGMN